MMYETLACRMDGRVAVVTLNRPDVLNAINKKMIAETKALMSDLIADSQVRAIVIHGAGRAFSAGFDLKESAQVSYSGIAQWQEVLERDFEFIMQFWDCPKPTIAAVHGHCLAGAFEMALACDVTVAADTTKFGEPEVRFGAGIVAMILPWATGPKAAKELLMTGNDRVSADDALRMGIVNRVVPAGEELNEAIRIAKDMSAAVASAVQSVKRTINRTYDIRGFREAMRTSLEADLIMSATGSAEKDEFNQIRRERGLKAALEWRDAKFR
ncbi:enoyl-CoA hydratase/isomerase family protein [Leptospira interrogans]